MAEVRVMRGVEEIKRVAELTTRACYGPEYFDAVVARVSGGLRDGTFMRPALCAVYVDDQGEIAGALQALELQVQVGRTPVRTAGFNQLAIEPALWGRDGAQRLMDFGRDGVRAAGFNLVLGTGIPHYYDRWGAAPVVIESSARLDARKVRGAVTRPFRAADLESDADLMTALHFDANQGRTGLVRRTPSMWRWSVRKADDYRVRDDAFFGFDTNKEELLVIDVGARSPGAYRDVVLASCAEAQARDLHKVTFVAPSDHAVVRAAIPHGVVVEQRYRQTGYWTARILDVRGFFAELQPELLRRLREASGPRLELRLRSGDESTELDLDGGGPGRVTASLELPIRDLTQLVFGYRAVSDVLVDHGVALEPDVVRALEVLFPEGEAHVWPVPW